MKSVELVLVWFCDRVLERADADGLVKEASSESRGLTFCLPAS